MKQEVNKSQTCTYEIPWVGKCGSAKTLDNNQCKNHQEKCSCGKVATHGCEETGKFVCGKPLCKECKCNCKSR